MMLRHDATSLPATRQTAARSSDTATASATQVTPERLMQLTFGFAPPLIIEAAIRHRVFDLLDEGAKTVEKLCAETQTSSRGLRAILNALVGLELLAKDDEERYALTPESAAFLVRGKLAFHGAFFLLTSEPMLSEWAPRHCPQRATGEAYQSGAGRRSILPAIRRRHLPDTLRRRAAVERSARGVESRCAFVRARFGRRIRRVERRARAAIAARARDGGGLAGCDPDHAEGHSAFWCRGPIPFRSGRPAGSKFRQRTRHRHRRAYSAQRGGRAQPLAARKDLRCARARRDHRHHGDLGRGRSHGASASADFRGQHAGELGPRRYLLLGGDQRLAARRRLRARAYLGSSWAGALAHLGDKVEPLKARRRDRQPAPGSSWHDRSRPLRNALMTGQCKIMG